MTADFHCNDYDGPPAFVDAVTFHATPEGTCQDLRPPVPVCPGNITVPSDGPPSTAAGWVRSWPDCGAVGVTPDSVPAYTTCLVRRPICGAADAVALPAPRSAAMFALGGVAPEPAFCGGL